MTRNGDDRGARWWRESQILARLRAPIGGAALLSAACIHAGVPPAKPSAAGVADTGDVETRMPGRSQGQDVGDAGRLVLADRSPVDARGTTDWRDELEDLATDLMPARDSLVPYYVPTLFQSLVGPRAARLRAEIQPIHPPLLDDDFGRGQALRELFEQAGWPRDTAIVIDAPGPRSVAVAAALADRFDPVFVFGNWPHPAELVP